MFLLTPKIPKAKGRVTFSIDFLKEVFGVPKEMRIQSVSYDRAFGLITLVGFSDEAIEGFTLEFKDADPLQEVFLTKDHLRRCQHENLETE